MNSVLRAIGVFLLALSLLPGAALTSPVHYQWSGTFETGSGPFNNRHFTIAFTVADPSMYGGSYSVRALLAIEEISTIQQSITFNFVTYATTTAGLGGFTNVLQPGDSLFFGICTGGSCNDPVLWNGIPASPVLSTGTFALGLDSSCTLPPGCNNAIANWFDGAGHSVTTRYVGTLVVTTADAIYDPASGLLTLPAVRVGAVTYINVTLQNVGSYRFNLLSATLQSPPGPARATYDGTSGILTIPLVQFGRSDSYVNVTLQNIGNYVMVLIGATAQP